MAVPLAPMAMRSLVTMMFPIAVGANACVNVFHLHWRQWRSPLATIGSIIMEPMDSLDIDALFTTPLRMDHLEFNGASGGNSENGTNGDSFVTMATVASLSPIVPLSPLGTVAIAASLFSNWLHCLQ